MTEPTERTIPKVDDNYPGFCCAGFDYEIFLILPNRPDEPTGYTTIYGACRNPNCPNFTEGDPEDPWRGVNSCDLDDFEEILAEKGVKVAEVAQKYYAVTDNYTGGLLTLATQLEEDPAGLVSYTEITKAQYDKAMAEIEAEAER